MGHLLASRLGGKLVAGAASSPVYNVVMQTNARQKWRAAIGVACTLLMHSVGRTDPTVAGDPGLRADVPGDVNRPFAQELASSAAPDLFLALSGSIAVNSSSAQLPAWDPKLVAILRGTASNDDTTVAIADLQGTLMDPDPNIGYPYPWDLRPVYRAPPGVADALKDRGLSMLARANGHALDWGIEGMRATGAALDKRALIHAGTGEREGLARMASYLDEPGGKGRIALLSTATTFRPTSSALSPWGAAVGRAGISAMDVDATRIVPAAQGAQLQRIACHFQYPQQPERCEKLAPLPAVSLFGSRFATSGATAGREFTSEYVLNTSQLASELRSVREAKQNADLAVLAISADQQERPSRGIAQPSAMLVGLAHAAIDSGADLIMVTGLPVLGPIEIYRPPGRAPRAILYGLGNLYWSPEAAPATTGAEVYDSVIVRSTVSGSSVALEIYPVALDAADGLSGIPHLASAARGRAILERLQRISSAFQTTIAVQNYGGTVRGLVRVVDPPVRSTAP